MKSLAKFYILDIHIISYSFQKCPDIYDNMSNVIDILFCEDYYYGNGKHNTHILPLKSQ